MTNIELGSLVLNTKLLVCLLAGAAGVLAVWSGGGAREREQRERDINIAWSAGFLWLAIWKGSLLLIDLEMVLANPMSLLYFDGGRVGFWLASLGAAGWAGFRFMRLPVKRVLAFRQLVLLISGWSSAYLLAVLLLAPEALSYGQILFAILALAAWWPAGRMERLAEIGSAGAPGKRRLAAQLGTLVLMAGLVSAVLYDQARAGFGAKAPEGDGGAAAAVGASAGKRAPGFELESLGGELVALEDVQGSVVLLNFWTTWCRVCKTEMPHVQKLYEYYQNEGQPVELLSVNVTSQEGSMEDVRRYMEEYGYTFPLLLDTKGAVTEQLRVSAFPSTFILDSEGVIRERFVGAISFEDMLTRIERVRKAEEG
ncbi:TlpA disulfide reductase family protein [Paenibacillus sp. PL2-23]|uniref:TlpA family protein disulfide reductase n=1 Tax=Paenibacillus sp. PL2-23 TaxID=2100729 RepID=UPI0030F96B57